MGGGDRPFSAALFTSSFQRLWVTMAASEAVSCKRRNSAIFPLRPRSTDDSPRLETSIPGVFPVPDKPTTATHRVSGSDQLLDALTRRAAPTMLATTPSSGTATCAGVTPAPWAASTSHCCMSVGIFSTGNCGSSPRRSSRIDQSGSDQVSFPLAPERLPAPPSLSAAYFPSVHDGLMRSIRQMRIFERTMLKQAEEIMRGKF